MRTPVDTHQLVLESRVARLQYTVADLTSRIGLAEGIAAEGALRRRRAAAQAELEKLLSEHGIILSAQQSPGAPQAERVG